MVKFYALLARLLPIHAFHDAPENTGVRVNENEIADIIIKYSIKIHKTLGPGLLESVYENLLAYELRKKGLHVEKQVILPIKYENIVFNEGFRADLTVKE